MKLFLHNSYQVLAKSFQTTFINLLRVLKILITMKKKYLLKYLQMYCKTGNFRASNFSRSATLPTHSRVVAFAHSKYLTCTVQQYAHDVVDMYLPLHNGFINGCTYTLGTSS